MSKPGKDSSEVVEFMVLFKRLKLYCDDAPDHIAELSLSDPSVKDLCTELFFKADILKRKERHTRQMIAAPVDPDFLSAWRDYEERYDPAVIDVWAFTLLNQLGDSGLSQLGGIDLFQTPKADRNWNHANSDAEEQANGIEQAINWARSEIENDILEDEDFLEELTEGVAAWDRLVSNHGLELRGVFRRRALVPFVLVPRKVAAKHGSAEKLSMLKHLQQAHDAFVFGANYAALALMRSIMESVLRDHYAAEGKDLYERIRNVRGHLPPGANEAALHRLRKLANAILHLDREKDEGLLNMDEMRLEKEIVSLLLVIRALIEGAK